MEGWLWKKGAKRKNWRRRYFKLRGKQLMYYKGPTDAKPKGIVDLNSVLDLAAVGGESGVFLDSSGRKGAVIRCFLGLSRVFPFPSNLLRVLFLALFLSFLRSSWGWAQWQSYRTLPAVCAAPAMSRSSFCCDPGDRSTTEGMDCCNSRPAGGEGSSG